MSRLGLPEECSAQLYSVPEYFEQTIRAPRKMSPHGLKCDSAELDKEQQQEQH